MKIEYPFEWDEQEIFERKCKGWLSDVAIILDDNSTHYVSFYDPIRLAQDLEVEIHAGKAGLIEKGLLIVPTVTKENIEKIVTQAIIDGFFDA